MQNKQRYVTAAVTIAAAAITAHLMQRSSEPNSPNQPPSATAALAASVPGLGIAPPTRVQNEVTIVAPVPTAPQNPAFDESIAAAVITPDPTISETSALLVPALARPDGPMPAPRPDRSALSGSALPPTETLPTPPADVLTPNALPQIGTSLPGRLAQTPDKPSLRPGNEEARNAYGIPCGAILSAAPVVDGLVNLTLTAPCRTDERFTLGHGGIQFSSATDSLGTFQATVPGLQPQSRFEVAFESGGSVEVTTDVLGVDSLERVALVAGSTSGFQIHALEFGADYGELGHVWAQRPGDIALAAMEGNGYLMRLGDPALPNATIAEVYTFPRVGTDRDGTVRLSVEAEVTSANCNTDVSGKTIEPGPDGVPLSRSMTVAMPDCDAIGEYLVLKNLLRDLRIASNN